VVRFVSCGSCRYNHGADNLVRQHPFDGEGFAGERRLLRSFSSRASVIGRMKGFSLRKRLLFRNRSYRPREVFLRL
jgi:hypothetical protein